MNKNLPSCSTSSLTSPLHAVVPLFLYSPVLPFLYIRYLRHIRAAAASWAMFTKERLVEGRDLLTC
jgi:hypothetical protein